MRVVVTGASSGLGRAFAESVRAKYPDAELWVVGRNEAGLPEGEKLLLDLSTEAGRVRLEERLKAQPPDLLVNCAGLAYYGSALTHTLEEEAEMVAVNVLALQQLTLAAASVMKGGTILNVSSAAGFLPFPGNATYSATKAFVTNFSEGLDLELEGIRVLAFCPGQIATPFSKRASKGRALSITRRSVMPIEKTVEAMWQQIERGKRVVVYDWRYWLGVKFLWLVPRGWLGRYLQAKVTSG
ncbi:MAG: SDR family NAD(P)-dependent oxidoreductase [Parachlamydiales bacterium]